MDNGEPLVLNVPKVVEMLLEQDKQWRLVERYCEHYPDDWRLVFRRGDEVLEMGVAEEVWRAFG